MTFSRRDPSRLNPDPVINLNTQLEESQQEEKLNLNGTT